MIITGGENVSPVEIESCLSLHPAVSEVAVVGSAGRALGQDRRGLRQARARRSSAEELDATAALRASPTSSARAATCSSRRSQNLRSASCCAASSSPATISRSARQPLSDSIGTSNEKCDDHPMTFADPRLAELDGFRVEIDAARERADIILDRPPFNIIAMPQRDQLRARVRSARRGPARAGDRAARRRRAFLQRRQHQGLSGSHARACVASLPGTSPRRRAAPSR